MARCKKCNQVFSDSYLVDGICEDCIEEHRKYKELNPEQIKLKNRLSSKYDLNLNSFLKAEEEVKELKSIHNIDIDIDTYLSILFKHNLTFDKFLTIKKEIERFKSIHNNIDINIEIYLSIQKKIMPFWGILLKKRRELVTLDAYGNSIFDTWYNEIDYFIKNLNMDNNLIYEPIIKDIIISEIEERISSNTKTLQNKLSAQANVNKEDIEKGKNTLIGFIIIIVIIILIMSFSSTSTKSSSNYQDRLDRENANKAEDIRKLAEDTKKIIDDAKYQEYKRNH